MGSRIFGQFIRSRHCLDLAKSNICVRIFLFNTFCVYSVEHSCQMILKLDMPNIEGRFILHSCNSSFDKQIENHRLDKRIKSRIDYLYLIVFSLT